MGSCYDVSLAHYKLVELDVYQKLLLHMLLTSMMQMFVSFKMHAFIVGWRYFTDFAQDIHKICFYQYSSVCYTFGIGAKLSVCK